MNGRAASPNAYGMAPKGAFEPGGLIVELLCWRSRGDVGPVKKCRKGWIGFLGTGYLLTNTLGAVTSEECRHSLWS